MVQDIFNIKRAFESNLNEEIIVMIQKQHIFINRSERREGGQTDGRTDRGMHRRTFCCQVSLEKKLYS